MSQKYGDIEKNISKNKIKHFVQVVPVAIIPRTILEVEMGLYLELINSIVLRDLSRSRRPPAMMEVSTFSEAAVPRTTCC